MRMPYIGSGQEATVYRGQITIIPGIGGKIRQPQPVEVARRVDHSRQQGEAAFLRHLAIFLLDQSFLHQGNYAHPHVALPLGSYRNGYFYEYVEGGEGFPWQITDYSSPAGYWPVTLQEFRDFCGTFSQFGFAMDHDISDATDGRSGKNILVRDGYDLDTLFNDASLPASWVRIDFGSQSCLFDKGKFALAMQRAEGTLLDSISENEYRILAYYARRLSGQQLNEIELENFYALIGQFRLAASLVFTEWLKADTA